MQSTYCLRFQGRHVAHFARVTLEISPAQEMGRVWVDARAFDWLRDVYGPDAWRWSVCDAWARGAIEAAQLRVSDLTGAWDVCIQRIEGRPADTNPRSVAFAVCKAMDVALGLSSALPIIRDGALVFEPSWSDVLASL